ncbi:MAG: GGDEF domain-containing protein [Acidobacteria bacterium]|nr:GGDEF domain-containing protein [Acidobacteriota bacterium]
MSSMVSQTFTHQLRERLSVVERRDWELWGLALGTVGVLVVGVFFFLLPSFLEGQKNIRIQAELSPALAGGLLVLLLLLTGYLAQKHVQLRSARHRSILEAVNFELAHAQLLIDPVTRTWTRAALQELLGRELNRVQRRQGTLVLLYIDADNFRQVNSRYGHLTGDLVLAEIGGFLKQSIRGSDYAIRMGGDEFLVALVDTDLPGANSVKTRILEYVSEWNSKSAFAGLSLSLSIGIEEFDAERSLDDVLAAVDSRMYADKATKSPTPSEAKWIKKAVPTEGVTDAI